jgi:hypothetical protein
MTTPAPFPSGIMAVSFPTPDIDFSGISDAFAWLTQPSALARGSDGNVLTDIPANEFHAVAAPVEQAASDVSQAASGAINDAGSFVTNAVGNATSNAVSNATPYIILGGLALGAILIARR